MAELEGNIKTEPLYQGPFEGGDDQSQQYYPLENTAANNSYVNDSDYESATLRTDYSMDNSVHRGRNSRGGGPGRPFRSPSYAGGGGGGPARPTDFPLRILVLSDMVGAIIGRSGGTIKQITQETRARVDVHRKENAGSLEKVITIYGNPENCSKACQKIMEVMQTEANNTSRGEIPLKILAHNNLIGRIIGKNGNTIKRIMEQTNTKITVSTNIHDVNSFNLERVITIKGNIEDICKAEQMISSKLRQSYESDLAVMAPQALMFPGLHPMAMMSTLGTPSYPQRGGPPQQASYGMYGGGAQYIPPVMPYGAGPSAAPPQMSPGGHGAPPMPPLSHHQDQTKETVYLYIPNTAVGAIIGTGGSTIRDMISSSSASIKVAQPIKEEAQQPAQPQTQAPIPLDRPAERKVTIMGTPEAQWKAQFMIFRKVGYEGLTGPQEATLKVEIFVPSSQVGRIIGKGGSTVRELQRMTHAIIKLPEEGQNTTADETPVHIIGDFLSTQAAQRQIRALVVRGTLPLSGARGGRRPVPPTNHQPLPDVESSAGIEPQQQPTSQQPPQYDSPSPTAAQSQ